MAEKGKLGKAFMQADFTLFPPFWLKLNILDPVIGRDEEIRRTIEGELFWMYQAYPHHQLTRAI